MQGPAQSLANVLLLQRLCHIRGVSTPRPLTLTELLHKRRLNALMGLVQVVHAVDLIANAHLEEQIIVFCDVIDRCY